ncbi:HDIG domain-containing protein [Fervidobacterium changbaicum]|uniref:HD domain-containing protein n=2 Tax=Fervidobacterium TaxID=2422 RepID=A0AAI8GD16_FERIS|nr:HD domain-containing protein [Fervidobacterium islandicum]AMW32629.1 HD domain-containing protein [Fervidobacterium islandicum]QAV32517.1 HD domain-containing protein [Fervidobacterium changbaicum]SDH50937.1 HDIG domain-containing protein [Fervidobacterium changbaicum]
MIDILLKTIMFVPKFGVHSLQVGFIASKIAKELNLDELELFYCGALHDLGVLTPHKGVLLDDIDNEFLIKEDVQTFESPTKDHTLISAFEVSKISYLSKKFPNLSASILLHHALPHYLNENSTKDIAANIVSISEEISKYVLVNNEEMTYEDFVIPLSAIKNRFFDFVYEAALSVLKQEYVRWMLYDIKAGFNRERLIQDYYLREPMTFEEIVEMGAVLSYIIDSKSEFTRAHSWRVANLSGAIAKEILLKEQEFFVAGLFHDIGKITTPISVLEKKGKLTPSEMDIMKKHVYYSYLILLEHENEPWFWPAVRHQERTDGSGYPWRLKGSEMTFKDKILQVADYFVAVLEPRPYRGPNTPEKAYEEVQRAVSYGVLDPGPASILKELVYGGFDFESINFMSSIQKDINDFEKSLLE